MTKSLKYVLNETVSTISNNIFNHCSTVASCGKDLLCAWYSGSHECSKDQRVNIVNLHNPHGTVILEEQTGNPVLFNDSSNKTFILYSQFVHHPNISRIDKWKYCHLFLREVFHDHVSDRIKLSDESEHLLGRCSPIVKDGTTYLPLYNELDGYSVIYEGNGYVYEPTFCFGDLEIQPAIYHDGYNLKAFTRNFLSTRKFSRLHVVANNESKDTAIPNNNSSIAALRINDITFVVYNDSNTKLRKSLTIGYYSEKEGIVPIRLIDEYGSYPSVILHEGKLVISYTDYFHSIKVHEIDIHRFLNECGYRRLLR